MDRERPTDYREQYGVDLVSGFYGPGTWGGWLLLMLSTVLDSLFASDDGGEGWSNILGVDVNLAGALAYPLVAAVDFLAHMDRYFDEDTVEDRDLGRLDASLLVLYQGLVLGFIVVIVKAVRSRFIMRKAAVTPHDPDQLSRIRRRAWAAALCPAAAWGFMLIVSRILEFRFGRYNWLAIADSIFFFPIPGARSTPRQSLFMIYCRNFLPTFRPFSSFGPLKCLGMPLLSLDMMPFDSPLWWMLCAFKVAILVGQALVLLGSILTGDLFTFAYSTIAGEICWWCFLVLLELTGAMFLRPLLSVKGGAVPLTNARFRDLDQLTAFIIGGILPVAFSLHAAIGPQLGNITGLFQGSRN